MKRMAIIYYSNYLDWPAGGMLQYLDNIIPELAKEYEIDIYGCSVNGKKPKDVTYNNKRYHVHVLGNMKTHHKIVPNYLRYLFYTFIAAKRIDSKKYDVVYFHSAPICLSYLKRIQNKQTIYAYHQHGLSCRNRISTFVQDWSMKNSDVVFVNATAEEIANKEREIGVNKKLIQAPSQVDASILTSFTSTLEKPIFVYSGRITEWKRPILLLDAFQKLLEVLPDAKLIYVGDGDQAEMLSNLIKKYQIEESVKITGFIDHDAVIKYLCKAAVFVMPSKGEGLSLSVIEALAVGLPVVCFKVNGLTELIKNDYNGLIVSNNTAEELCNAMNLAFMNRHSYKKNTKSTAELYTIEKVSDVILTAIRRRLSDKNG